MNIQKKRSKIDNLSFCTFRKQGKKRANYNQTKQKKGNNKNQSRNNEFENRKSREKINKIKS